MSQNAVIGDSYGVVLPQTELPKEQLDNEKRLAKFSKTEEFKRLKEHLEERRDWYQSHLPDGRPVTEVPQRDMEGMWVIANAIIGEFNFIINRYELAGKAVEDAQRKDN